MTLSPGVIDVFIRTHAPHHTPHAGWVFNCRLLTCRCGEPLGYHNGDDPYPFLTAPSPRTLRSLAPNQIRVRRARHSKTGGRRNWVVEDRRPTVEYQFVFSTFRIALQEADRLARTRKLDPCGLVSAHRIGGAR